MKKLKGYKSIMPWLLILGAILCMEAYYILENYPLETVTRVSSPDTDGIYMEGTVVKQQFICESDCMDGIVLKADAVQVDEPEMISAYVERNGEVLEEWNFDSSQVKEGTVRLMFEAPVRNAVGEGFELYLTCKADSGVILGVGTEKCKGATLLSWSGSSRYDDRSLSYGIIKRNLSRKMIFIFIAFFTIFACAVLCFAIKRKHVQEEWVFAICYIILGIYLLVAVPIFKTPDEGTHFSRAYEISEGHLLSKQNPSGASRGFDGAGRELPKALKEMLKSRDISNTELQLQDVFEMMEYRIETDEKEFVGFSNTAMYAPGTYFPQVIGICISRIFTKRVILQAYGARFFNWAIAGILLFISLRLLPTGKKLAFLIMMLPMMVQQYNSMSADAFVFALCMFLTAFVLDQRLRRSEKMKWYHYLEMYLLVFFLCQCKVVYLPMCLLLFLIPKERFGSRGIYCLNICAVAILGALLFISWTSLSSDFMAEYREEVNAREQLLYILHQPLEYIKTLVRTWDILIETWIGHATGKWLGWMNIQTSPILTWVYGVLIWIYTLLDNDIKAENIEKIVRYIFGLTAGIIVLLIFTGAYLQWTPLHKGGIEGIQGRYFLPVLFPAMLALKPRVKSVIDGQYMYLSVLGINLIIFTILICYAL